MAVKFPRLLATSGSEEEYSKFDASDQSRSRRYKCGALAAIAFSVTLILCVLAIARHHTLPSSSISLAETEDDESFSQTIWSILVNPKGNFKQLRSDVVVSRMSGAVVGALVSFIVGKACTTDNQLSSKERDDMEIAQKSWGRLDAQIKAARLTPEAIKADVTLILARYQKTTTGVIITSVVRLIAAHAVPCSLIFRLCSGEPVPGWYSGIMMVFTYAYYATYAVAALGLFAWTYLSDYYVFSRTFVLPAVAVPFCMDLSLTSSAPKDLWKSAEVNGCVALVLSVAALVCIAPHIVAAGVSDKVGVRAGVFPIMLFFIDVVFTILAAIGLVIAVIRQTPFFWFLVTLLTAAPGAIFSVPLVCLTVIVKDCVKD